MNLVELIGIRISPELYAIIKTIPRVLLLILRRSEALLCFARKNWTGIMKDNPTVYLQSWRTIILQIYFDISISSSYYIV